MMQNDRDHLLWIYKHMVVVHGEHRGCDHMLKFKRIIDGVPEIKLPAKVADLATFKCCKVFRKDGTYECKRCGLWWDHNDEKPECAPAMIEEMENEIERLKERINELVPHGDKVDLSQEQWAQVLK